MPTPSPQSKKRFTKTTPHKLQAVAAKKKVKELKTQKEVKKKFYCPPLVERNPLSAEHAAVFLGPQEEQCYDALRVLTGQSPVKPHHLDITPNGGHLRPDKNGRCGRAANGSPLIQSDTKTFKVVERSPAGKHTVEHMVYLLVHQKNHVAKKTDRVLQPLSTNTVVVKPRITVKATPATRASQVKRSQLLSQIAVMGRPARIDAIKFFGLKAERKIWHWCHGLSCAISQKAIEKNGKEFPPQTVNNLHVGTIVYNRNMMRVENPVLELLNKAEVEFIEYSADQHVIKNTQIAKSIDLKVRIETHDHRMIAFDYSFCADENREFSHDLTKVLYAQLIVLVRKPVPVAKPDCAMKLMF